MRLMVLLTSLLFTACGDKEEDTSVEEIEETQEETEAEDTSSEESEEESTEEE